jgi:hypothetical protein
MADPTVIIRVTTNADQATKGLQRAAKNLSEASTPRGATPTTRGVAPGASSASRLNFGMGLQIAGQGVDLLAQGIGNLQGGRRTGDRISALGQGALGGAATGMMIGGPVGAAIGGAAGLVVGAFKQLSEEAKETREGLMALRLSADSSVQSASASRQDDAFYTTLKYKSKEERQSAINERIEQLSSGGKYSIESITKRQEKRIREGRTDSEAYKFDEMMLAQQKSRLTTLFGKQWEESKTIAHNPLEASTVTDSLGAMGGIVGPQVDIADVNKDMLSELKRINSNLERMGSYNPAEALEVTSIRNAFGV